MEKLFMNAADIAEDLGIDEQMAAGLVRNLTERLRNKGIITVTGAVQTSYYLQMREVGFVSDDGKRAEKPVLEKRLITLKEFCTYSSLGQHAARKLAADIGIEKRIGRKVLYDRVLFDRWCDSCRMEPVEGEREE